MARILYGVCGEGRGHSSRAKEITTYLEKEGHQVKLLSYDKGYTMLSPYFDIARITGPRLSFGNNKIKYLKTALKNCLKSPGAIRSVRDALRIVNEFKPQLILSDLEPTSFLVANIKKIPFISIGNHHLLTNTRIEYPRKYMKDAATARAVTNLITPRSKAYLVTAFLSGEIKNKKTFIFPPLLRKEVLETTPEEGNHILVYLASPFNKFMETLKQIDKKFIVYGFEKDEQEGNICFKSKGPEEFLRDLAESEGVIANAGFTLITEALFLGKPYLAFPIKGHFEQILNAYHLEKLGYGKYWEKLNKERIESFLYNLDFYKKNLKSYKREDNSKIFRAIDDLIEKYTS